MHNAGKAGPFRTRQVGCPFPGTVREPEAYPSRAGKQGGMANDQWEKIG